MERESINLFKQRFLDYNRERYQYDKENWYIAFNTLDVDDITVFDFEPDLESENEATIVTKVESDKFSLYGINQSYIKVPFGSPTIAKLSDLTVYPDLQTVLNMNTLGVFFYEPEVEGDPKDIVITTNFVHKADDGLALAKEVITRINENTHWDIKLVDCSIEVDEENTVENVIVVDVDISNNHTIYGKLKVAQIPTVYPLGTYPYEYLGKVSEHAIFSKEQLLNLANLHDSDFDQYQPNEPLVWLKFRKYGKIFYVPKMPILSGVTWTQLFNRGMCLGKTIITGNDGLEYRVRLPLYDKTSSDPDDHEDEFYHLLTRCMRGTELGEEWEAFNYLTEMHWQNGVYHSAPLMEGLDELSPITIAGVGGDPETYKTINKTTSYTTGPTAQVGNYVSWLPVLEFRGVDPIDPMTVSMNYNDILEMVPEQLDFEQSGLKGMVRGVRYTGMKFVGPGIPNIKADNTPQEAVSKVFHLTVKYISGTEVPSIEVNNDVAEGGVSKINYKTVELEVGTKVPFIDVTNDPQQSVSKVVYQTNTLESAAKPISIAVSNAVEGGVNKPIYRRFNYETDVPAGEVTFGGILTEDLKPAIVTSVVWDPETPSVADNARLTDFSFDGKFAHDITEVSFASVEWSDDSESTTIKPPQNLRTRIE